MKDERKYQLIARYAYLIGRTSMAWDLSVWKDGVPVVGVMEVPHKTFAAKDIEEMKELQEELGMTDDEILGIAGLR